MRQRSSVCINLIRLVIHCIETINSMEKYSILRPTLNYRHNEREICMNFYEFLSFTRKYEIHSRKNATNIRPFFSGVFYLLLFTAKTIGYALCNLGV